MPYDGTYLLYLPKPVSFQSLAAKMVNDATFAGVINALVAESQRQAAVSTAVKQITMVAKPPTAQATIQFVDNTQFTISDCFALCNTDPTFAGVFGSVLTELARQAGLPAPV